MLNFCLYVVEEVTKLLGSQEVSSVKTFDKTSCFRERSLWIWKPLIISESYFISLIVYDTLFHEKQSIGTIAMPFTAICAIIRFMSYAILIAFHLHNYARVLRCLI